MMMMMMMMMGLGSGVVGISEEALEFVREISLRPQCWTDFPLALDDIDFDMSSAQREHASTVEHLAPSLADLKMNLCPSNMKEEHFWMIYFILLHPRLHKHDVELLSTAQIVETRDILLQTLQKRTNAQLQTSTADGLSLEVNENGNDIQEERSSVEEKKVFGKTVIAEDQEDLDVYKWLEEDVETGPFFNSRNQLGNEQDVSFSDLEDDDNDTSSSNPAKNIHLSSPNESSGWVQLSENSKPSQPASQQKDSESEESNEWLTVDEFDTESVGTA
ncbi:hypothetical protein IFM89_012369 [Coptis chinensis]|uniref:BSD domain-containing protein n=1 Tax=Coptis chinensis TaxID=261450 RepID=A0A835M2C9_9MAGN|nr:hypothetical protein IFM89_012369 [Coptis chinensis]